MKDKNLVKTGLTIGVTLIFILSSLIPTAFGQNNKDSFIIETEPEEQASPIASFEGKQQITFLHI